MEKRGNFFQTQSGSSAKMEKSCGAVLYRLENGAPLFLILHYSKGHYDFPKGHVEKGETEEQTLRREVGEETGIRDMVIDNGFRETIGYYFRRAGRSVRKEVVFFLAQTSSGEVRLSGEHVAFEWLSFERALSRLTYENGRNVLRKASARIGGKPS